MPHTPCGRYVRAMDATARTTASPRTPAEGSDWVTWRQLTAADAPTVSVVVPVGEDDSDLDIRLPAVLRQTVRPHEVIVIDASRDGRHLATLASVEQRESHTAIRYVRLPAAGADAIRRLGARLANGNVRAFLQAGVTVPATWIERIAAALRGLQPSASHAV